MVRSSHVGYIVFTSWTHMNATTKSLLLVGNYKFSLSPEFPSCGRVSSQRLKICSIGKVVEMNKIIIFCNVQ